MSAFFFSRSYIILNSKLFWRRQEYSGWVTCTEWTTAEFAVNNDVVHGKWAKENPENPGNPGTMTDGKCTILRWREELQMTAGIVKKSPNVLVNMERLEPRVHQGNMLPGPGRATCVRIHNYVDRYMLPDTSCSFGIHVDCISAT